MGLIHSYEIHLPPGNIAKALTLVAEPALPTRDVPPLEVTLPGGDRVVLPFTSGFESEPVDCSSGGTFELDTSLMIGIDDVMRAYLETHGGGGPEEVCRLNGETTRETIGGSRFPDRRALVSTWPAPGRCEESEAAGDV